MTLRKKHLADEVNQRLVYLQLCIESNSAQNLNDLAVSVEEFFASFLNALFELDLRNLNREKQNYPAIDLGDDAAGVCFQVTAESGLKKVRSTIATFIKHSLFKKFTRLRFMMVTTKRGRYKTLELDSLRAHKVQFSPDEDILNITSVMTDVRSLELSQLESVWKVCVEEVEYRRWSGSKTEKRLDLILAKASRGRRRK